MELKVNNQAPEPMDLRADGSLEITGDPFLTIQGEGPFVGSASVFVRLAGCSLQCSSCDTDYTSNRKRFDPEKLLIEVDKLSKREPNKKPKIKLLVITGGEPFRQNLVPFVNMCVREAFYQVQIETNGLHFVDEGGSYAFRNSSVSIVCSPKTPNIHTGIAVYAKAFKYVLHHEHVDENDGLPSHSLGMSQKPYRACNAIQGQEIFLQPEYSEDKEVYEKNLKSCIDSCLKHGYRLSTQIHKQLGLP